MIEAKELPVLHRYVYGGAPLDALAVITPVALVHVISNTEGLTASALVTVTVVVSVQAPPTTVHMKWYVPVSLKLVIVVVGLEVLVMTEVPGFPDGVVHAPVPLADIVAVPPGSDGTQGTVRAGPALLPLTIFTVSVFTTVVPSHLV